MRILLTPDMSLDGPPVASVQGVMDVAADKKVPAGTALRSA